MFSRFKSLLRRKLNTVNKKLVKCSVRPIDNVALGGCFLTVSIR